MNESPNNFINSQSQHGTGVKEEIIKRVSKKIKERISKEQVMKEVELHKKARELGNKYETLDQRKRELEEKLKRIPPICKYCGEKMTWLEEGSTISPDDVFGWGGWSGRGEIDDDNIVLGWRCLRAIRLQKEFKEFGRISVYNDLHPDNEYIDTPERLQVIKELEEITKEWKSVREQYDKAYREYALLEEENDKKFKEVLRSLSDEEMIELEMLFFPPCKCEFCKEYNYPRYFDSVTYGHIEYYNGLVWREIFLRTRIEILMKIYEIS